MVKKECLHHRSLSQQLKASKEGSFSGDLLLGQWSVAESALAAAAAQQ